jgi:hypothetical protein
MILILVCVSLFAGQISTAKRVLRLLRGWKSEISEVKKLFFFFFFFFFFVLSLKGARGLWQGIKFSFKVQIEFFVIFFFVILNIFRFVVCFC